jgi:hypothetical protein
VFLAMASPASSSTADQSGSGSKISEPIDDLLLRLGIEDGAGSCSCNKLLQPAVF